MKKKNSEFNVDMFISRIRSGKAFAANKKLESLKNYCLK